MNVGDGRLLPKLEYLFARLQPRDHPRLQSTPRAARQCRLRCKAIVDVRAPLLRGAAENVLITPPIAESRLHAYFLVSP
jgi:hypothetical protein